MLCRLTEVAGLGHLPGTALRAVLAAGTAWLLCILAGPFVLRQLARLGIRERTEKTPIEDDALRRSIADKSGTLTMGGLILLAGLFGACAAWADLTDPLLLLALAVTGAMAVVGVADDRAKILGRTHTQRGLKVCHKLILQGVTGAALGLLLVQRTGRPLLGLSPSWGPWIVPAGLAWSALVVATMSNATNVTDGLDGLLAGLAVPAAVVLGIACWAAGSARPAVAELSVFCAALAGACLGFLRFNRHPARVFMGDTGSMAVGAGLAAVALAAGQEVVLGLAGLVFLLEFGSSLLQIGWFHAFGRRILPFAPVHHVFQKKDYPEPRIVLGFYLVGGAAALAGLGSLLV